MLKFPPEKLPEEKDEESPNLELLEKALKFCALTGSSLTKNE